MLLCLKTGTELASERSFFFKKLDNRQSPKKIVSVTFSRAVFSLLFTHDGLASLVLVWQFVCEFKTILHM